MSTVNEFALNFPISSVGSPEPAAAVAGYSPVDMTPLALPADVDGSQCEHISVYVDSTQMVNYDPKSPTALVDMVLSVCITDPTTGAAKTYKMVKRMSMDKCKLACDAEQLTPVQVVEAEEDPVEVAKIMEAFHAARRARQIAGLSEVIGSKCFEVSYKDGEETCAVKIDKVKDKAHARYMFSAQRPNAKILRATEIK